ncbi:hypothetical protein O181_066926 [Austropuccinia psidii MF-1]|uniref:Zn(2)-C6 fungal-type domain-containing protein n=1 Tax=Austropuccinia psidii MF-1 TaxID=1389203 RepID=A0A9Q3EYL5_9BASI|nr:hypothetical protein [Austropuccinia psidii MF-1]
MTSTSIEIIDPTQPIITSMTPTINPAQTKIVCNNNNNNNNNSSSSNHHHRQYNRTSSSTIQTKEKPTKRRKVAKACLFCKRSHMTCDDSRPCQRCIKRDIGHLCCDDPPQSATNSNSKVKDNKNLTNQIRHLPPRHLHHHSSSTSTFSTRSQPSQQVILDHLHHPIHHPNHLNLSNISNLSNLSNHQINNLNLSQSPSSTNSHPILPINSNFSLIDPSISLSSSSSSHSQISLATNNHALVSSDLLPHLFSPTRFNFNSPTLSSYPITINPNSLDRSIDGILSSSSNSKLFLDLGTNSINRSNRESETDISENKPDRQRSFSAQDEPAFDLNEFLTAYPGLFTATGNDTLLTPKLINFEQSMSGLDSTICQATHQSSIIGEKNDVPDRLESIIRSAGLEAFDFSASEAEMTKWIDEENLEPFKSKMRECWIESQKLFLPITASQSEPDKVESEFQFKRNLVDYSTILDALPVPACIWRRTGEICRTNASFNNLIGAELRVTGGLETLFGAEKKLEKSANKAVKIYAIWDSDSNLNYFEKFNRIALDEGQKAVLTSCVLLKQDVRNQRLRESVRTAQDEKLKTKQDKEDQGDDSHRSGIQETSGGSDENVKDKDTQTCLSSSSFSLASSDCAELIPCTFSFTVKRDSFGLPSLIVGNFLPS